MSRKAMMRHHSRFYTGLFLIQSLHEYICREIIRRQINITNRQTIKESILKIEVIDEFSLHFYAKFKDKNKESSTKFFFSNAFVTIIFVNMRSKKTWWSPLFSKKKKRREPDKNKNKGKSRFKRDMSIVDCYSCGKMGHYNFDCKKSKRSKKGAGRTTSI